MKIPKTFEQKEYLRPFLSDKDWDILLKTMEMGYWIVSYGIDVTIVHDESSEHSSVTVKLTSCGYNEMALKFWMGR